MVVIRLIIMDNQCNVKSIKRWCHFLITSFSIIQVCHSTKLVYLLHRSNISVTFNLSFFLLSNTNSLKMYCGCCQFAGGWKAKYNEIKFVSFWKKKWNKNWHQKTRWVSIWSNITFRSFHEPNNKPEKMAIKRGFQN